MQFTVKELARLRLIMTRELKIDAEYEKEFGNDWGSTKDVDEKIMKKLQEVS